MKYYSERVLEDLVKDNPTFVHKFIKSQEGKGGVN